MRRLRDVPELPTLQGGNTLLIIVHALVCFYSSSISKTPTFVRHSSIDFSPYSTDIPFSHLGEGHWEKQLSSIGVLGTSGLYVACQEGKGAISGTFHLPRQDLIETLMSPVLHQSAIGPVHLTLLRMTGVLGESIITMAGQSEVKTLKVGFLGLGIMGVAMVRTSFAGCKQQI